ncbi:gamma-glutamylcyclotransferase [Chryseolinea sp. T2]|uniref:gamma-glutamylcyclotransferase n=1 Tax=Chryseolinea sp. T2 TaxID=3129255 RepID=UPI003076A95F
MSQMSIKPLGNYAFYGTLRMGMENHQVFAKTLVYLKTTTLQGYRMYSLAEYPYVIRTGVESDSIVVDLFQITSGNTEEMIYEMEIDAGYVLSTVTIEGIKFGIYLFETTMTDDEVVEGGDWVSYTKSQFF